MLSLLDVFRMTKKNGVLSHRFVRNIQTSNLPQYKNYHLITLNPKLKVETSNSIVTFLWESDSF